MEIYRETCMFLCFHVFMYFLHLVPPFTPHYIINGKATEERLSGLGLGSGAE